MMKFSDYDGPQGAYVATGTTILPLNSAEGYSALAQAAMLTSLGATQEAKEYQAKVQESLKITRELEAAYRTD